MKIQECFVYLNEFRAEIVQNTDRKVKQRGEEEKKIN